MLPATEVICQSLEYAQALYPSVKAILHWEGVKGSLLSISKEDEEKQKGATTLGCVVVNVTCDPLPIPLGGI